MKKSEDIMMTSNPVEVYLGSLGYHGPAVEIVPSAEIELRRK